MDLGNLIMLYYLQRLFKGTCKRKVNFDETESGRNCSLFEDTITVVAFKNWVKPWGISVTIRVSWPNTNITSWGNLVSLKQKTSISRLCVTVGNLLVIEEASEMAPFCYSESDRRGKVSFWYTNKATVNFVDILHQVVSRNHEGKFFIVAHPLETL